MALPKAGNSSSSFADKIISLGANFGDYLWSNLTEPFADIISTSSMPENYSGTRMLGATLKNRQQSDNSIPLPRATPNNQQNYIPSAADRAQAGSANILRELLNVSQQTNNKLTEISRTLSNVSQLLVSMDQFNRLQTPKLERAPVEATKAETVLNNIANNNDIMPVVSIAKAAVNDNPRSFGNLFDFDIPDFDRGKFRGREKPSVHSGSVPDVPAPSNTNSKKETIRPANSNEPNTNNKKETIRPANSNEPNTNNKPANSNEPNTNNKPANSNEPNVNSKKEAIRPDVPAPSNTNNKKETIRPANSNEPTPSLKRSTNELQEAVNKEKALAGKVRESMMQRLSRSGGILLEASKGAIGLGASLLTSPVAAIAGATLLGREIYEATGAKEAVDNARVETSERTQELSKIDDVNTGVQQPTTATLKIEDGGITLPDKIPADKRATITRMRESLISLKKDYEQAPVDSKEELRVQFNQQSQVYINKVKELTGQEVTVTPLSSTPKLSTGTSGPTIARDTNQSRESNTQQAVRLLPQQSSNAINVTRTQQISNMSSERSNTGRGVTTTATPPQPVQQNVTQSSPQRLINEPARSVNMPIFNDLYTLGRG